MTKRRPHVVVLAGPNGAGKSTVAPALLRGRLGGHDVAEKTVRRRYRRGLLNFFALYQPLATTWRFYDNSGDHPRLVARGEGAQRIVVAARELWSRIKEAYHA